MHTDRFPLIDSIRRNVRRIAAAGLKFQITEFHCWTHKDRPDFEAQRTIYSSLIDLCLIEPNCDDFVMWGFTDKYSWLDNYYKQFNAGDGLILDRNYNTKASY
jgi:endo-1,4-beta-xylanase